MSTTGTEKHCRLCLMLTIGGTRACYNLFLKRVKELSPKDHQPYPWTSHQFLQSKKDMMKKSMLKDKFNVLFPKTGDTDPLKWDLSLFCEVLTSYCDLKNILRLDVERFRTLRNDLFHMNEPNITNDEFRDHLETIQTIISRVLENIDDQNVRLEIENTVETLENGPLALDEALREMRTFYLMEMNIHEKLERVIDVNETVLKKIETFDVKLEHICRNSVENGSAILKTAKNSLLPGVDIFIDLQNVSKDEEENMSVVLEQLFEEVIDEDNNFKSSIPADSFQRLRKAVKKTFQLFLSRGWKITSAKHKCIKLHINCNSFKALAALFREYVNGQVDEQLTFLKDALIECGNGNELCLGTTIHKNEFWDVLENSISSVEKFLSEHNVGSINPNDKEQQCDEGSKHKLTLTATKVRPICEQLTIEGDSSNELDTCLQLLKTELESELYEQQILIEISNRPNVNHTNEKVDEHSIEEIEISGSENITLTQTIDKIDHLSLTHKEHTEQFEPKEEREAQSGRTTTETLIIKEFEPVIENTLSALETGITPSYMKEESTASAEQTRIMHQKGLKVLYESGKAVFCYIELAILSLLDTRLQQKVFDNVQGCTDDIKEVYHSISGLAYMMKECLWMDLHEAHILKGELISTIIEIEGTIENYSRKKKSVKSTILELESHLKIKEPTIQERTEERESIYHLQKQCKDEERLTQEWHRDLEEALELYKMQNLQRTEDFSRHKDIMYGKQYSKKTHVDYDRKTHDINEFTTSLKTDVVRPTEIKQSLVDDRTEEEMLIITSEEAIRKEMLSKTLTMHQYPPHVKYSDVKRSQLDDLGGGNPIHKKMLTESLSIMLRPGPTLFNKKMLTESLSKMLQPGPALFSAYSIKYYDFQTETSVHTVLFSDPLFESNSDFLEEVIAFYSEFIKEPKGARDWTETLQLQGEQISHRCIQRIEVHLEIIDVQLKRITNTLSRVKMAVEKIEDDRDVFSVLDFSDVRQEWQQVRDDTFYIHIWLLTDRFLNFPSFGQLSREERNRKIRNILQDNERLISLDKK